VPSRFVAKVCWQGVIVTGKPQSPTNEKAAKVCALAASFCRDFSARNHFGLPTALFHAGHLASARSRHRARTASRLTLWVRLNLVQASSARSDISGRVGDLVAFIVLKVEAREDLEKGKGCRTRYLAQKWPRELFLLVNHHLENAT